MFAYHYLGRSPVGKVPVSLVKNLLQFAPLRKWLHVEKEAMDYFSIDSSYDTTHITRDLANTSIESVDLADTIVPMIEFYRKYKDDYTK